LETLTETNSTANSNHPIPEEVRAQLQRMLGSRVFSRSLRLRHFLQFTVEQTLTGNEETLKEYSIGLEVFQKPETFDPRVDSIVRVMARRLRGMVEAYYRTDGRDDDVIICFQSGSYVPTFCRRSGLTPSTLAQMSEAEVPDMLLVKGEPDVARTVEQIQSATSACIAEAPDGGSDKTVRIGVFVPNSSKVEGPAKPADGQPVLFLSPPLRWSALRRIIDLHPDWFAQTINLIQIEPRLQPVAV